MRLPQMHGSNEASSAGPSHRSAHPDTNDPRNTPGMPHSQRPPTPVHSCSPAAGPRSLQAGDAFAARQRQNPEPARALHPAHGPEYRAAGYISPSEGGLAHVWGKKAKQLWPRRRKKATADATASADP